MQSRQPSGPRLSAIPLFCLATMCFAQAVAQDLTSLARIHSTSPTPATRAALLRYANTRRGADGALALLALAASDLRSRRAEAAVPLLQSALPRLPKLADFIAYLQATAFFATSDFANAAEAAESIAGFHAASPMSGPAAAIAAKCYLAVGAPDRAVRLLVRKPNELAQPEGDILLASAYEAAGQAADAVAVFQRVWITYPNAPEANDAAAALARLRAKLGSRYRDPSPAALLTRAGKLIDGRDYARARAAYDGIAESATGAVRDLAAVRIGETDYRTRKDAVAMQYLASLQVADPDADAERLNFIAACARRLKRPDSVADALLQLESKHPRSEWRLRALVSAANDYWMDRPREAEVYFEACYTDFGDSPLAPDCHWRAAFRAYLANRSEWTATFKQHVSRYPESDKASAALYFLGRAAERGSRLADARTYYEETVRRYPNYYYAVLARSRLSDRSTAKVAASPVIARELAQAVMPRRISASHFAPSEDTLARFERARLLTSAALDDLAVAELRFGARTGSQPEAYGLQLARLSAARSAPEQAIRYLKRYAPGYLFADFESLPDEFWRLAFPLPYRADLERYSKENGLDPFTVAALIRQESEWDPKVVSRAQAYGLTQILPSTGRELSRRLGLGVFRTEMLFEPEYNLRLGAFYLRRLLDAFGGQWETALASYNAGKSRTDAWLARLSYRDTAEFVEQIPFNETRNYIQIVIRNSDIYRRLYASSARD